MEAGAPERPLPPLPRPLPDMLIFVDEIPYVCVQRYTWSEATQKFSQNNVCIAWIDENEGGLYFGACPEVGYWWRTEVRSLGGLRDFA
jgi:hypothetical protein